MNVGIPKEQRTFEFRVGLPPAGVEILKQYGHSIFVEHEAGVGAGFSDQEFEKAGARIVYSPEEVFGRADLLLKIARPLHKEIEWLQSGSIIAGLLHLVSARKDKIDLMLKNKITSVAYEQIEEADGTTPVKKPLAEIGGRLTATIAAHYMQNYKGGKGILLSGVPGVPPAEVVIIGGGVAGTAATRAFLGQGAHVTVLDMDLKALQRIDERFPGVVTMIATPNNIARTCAYADVVVGAVLVPGQRAPVVVTRDIVRSMKPRSMIIDMSIDQGGSVETSRPTTHEHCTYVEEGIIHYCVPNIPAAVARTATHAFVNAAMYYILDLANKDFETAIRESPALEKAINTHDGKMVHLNRLNGTEGVNDGLD
ncbi:MAG: alanine dehydrogenase [Anaerolineales bacterium]